MMDEVGKHSAAIGRREGPPAKRGIGRSSRPGRGSNWASLDTVRRDIQVLARFIETYCDQNHADRPKSPLKRKGPISRYLEGISPSLCPLCVRLLLHAVAKTAMCPYDPKPKCKNCQTHCYDKKYRAEIRKVMRFSGMYLMKRGRLDLAMHYFF